MNQIDTFDMSESAEDTVYSDNLSSSLFNRMDV